MKSKAISLGLAAVLLAAAVFLYLHFPSVRAQSASASSRSPKPVAKQSAPVPQTYTIYAGFWRTNGNFVSTIRIKNELVVAPLDITPVLYMADGTPYPLPSIHLPVAGVAFVNVNDALAKAPAKVASHISEFGSAELRWQYTSAGHVVASIQMLNVPQSLIFITPFNAIDTTMTGRQRLEGLWWRRDAGVDGYVSLANVTDGPVEVHLGMTGAHSSPQPGATVDLSAHTTQVLHLDDLLALSPQSPENEAGGVRVQYKGPMGSIMVTGGLENAGEGYSANMPFWFHDATSDKPAQNTYASVGMMAGHPDPMMGFPSTTVFTPYLALRNTTRHPLAVGLTLSHMDGGAPVSQAAPPVVLAPFESRQVDLRPALAALGLANFNGALNLDVSFKGNGGDLVEATGSVDQTGTYVFEVEPRGIAQSMSMISALWTTANGFDTMYNLLNPTDQAEDLVGIFYYADGSGSYKLPIHLEAHASVMIDMAMLRMSQQPDGDGHLIPAEEQVGSAIFQSAKGRRNWITLVIASGTYNVTTATCGNGCETCCGYTNPTMSPSCFTIDVGQSMPCALQATYCDGSVDNIGGSFSSEDTTVMSVDAYGNVTGVAGGSTTIDGSSGVEPVYSGQICYSGNPVPCPTGTLGGGANGTTNITVQITSTTISPNPTTINAYTSPKSTTLTVQVSYQAVSPNTTPSPSVTLEVGNASGSPPGNMGFLVAVVVYPELCRSGELRHENLHR